jgi:sortase A
MSRPLAHGLLRFVASVLIVTGTMMLADAALTLAWQEPITYLIAKHEQARLKDELRGLDALARRDERLITDKQGLRRFAALAALQRKRSESGHAIGRITLPRPHRSFVLVQGTDTASLRKGPGHYPQTPFPAERGTVAIAGHRTTYLAPFRTVNRLKHGDRITITMPYGRLVYSVEKTRIVSPDAIWVIKRRSYDRLVLSACHPKYSAAKRIVVFARFLGARDR